MEEWETSSLNNETSIDDFEDPAWAYKQAYRNGQRSTISRVKKLLSFMDIKD